MDGRQKIFPADNFANPQIAETDGFMMFRTHVRTQR